MATCPQCQHRFRPWNVVRISRWTCIPCPACGVLLNRRVDLRGSALVLGLLLAVAAATMLLPMGWWLIAVIFVVVPAVGWIVDACTVQLYVPTRRRRFLGYD